MAAEKGRAEHPQKAPHFRFGAWCVDVENRLLTHHGSEVAVTGKVFDLLVLLVQNQGRLLSKEELLKAIWPDSWVEESNLTQNISLLRKLLGDKRRSPRFIETVPKHGYRFTAPVVEVASEPDSVLAGATAALTPDRPAMTRDPYDARRPLFWKLLALSLVIVVLVVAIVGSWAVDSTSSAQPVERLAVLPFRNMGPDDPEEFLSISLADSVINDLSYVSALVVRPTSAVEPYRGKVIDPATAGRELEVDSVLFGSYFVEEEMLRIGAQLVDVESNEVVWSTNLDLPYENLIEIKHRVSRLVIQGLRQRLQTDVVLPGDAPRDPQAYRDYLKGVALIVPGSIEQAIELLKASVDRDPEFAPAWAQLGRAYNAFATRDFKGREYYLKAEKAFQRALQINPTQIEAKRFLAHHFVETNRAEQAIPLMRSVLHTNHNHPRAYLDLEYVYRYAGQLQEARAAAERALRLDPQVVTRTLNTWLYLGEYEEFLARLPAYETSHYGFYRGFARYLAGDKQSARAEVQAIIRKDPAEFSLAHTLLYLIDGNREDGLKMLARLELEFEERGVSDGELIYKVAQFYALFKDQPAALRNLKKAIASGFFSYSLFQTDPCFTALRTNSRFENVVRPARERSRRFRETFLTYTD